MAGSKADVGNGRFVGVQTWGLPDGEPVFLMHGTPGSRLGPRPNNETLERLGVWLICYDRPGFGDSDRLPDREVGHAAADAAAVADSLGIGSFAVVGRSGGAAHALACAALLRTRVTAVASLAGLAPREAVGLDWFEGMARQNVEEFRSAEAGEHELALHLKPIAEAIRIGMRGASPFDEGSLPESDRRVAADPAVRQMFREGFAEALKNSEWGWVDEDRSFCRPWGFDVSEICVPTLLWHGGKDDLTPVAHSRWLAERISDVTFEIDPAHGHMGTIHALPEALAWVRAAGRERRAGVLADGEGLAS